MGLKRISIKVRCWRAARRRAATVPLFLLEAKNKKTPVKVLICNWLRGPDSNRRPSGYEPDELPGCSTPRPSDALHDFQIVSSLKKNWLRGPDSNRRPSGYEPDELPGCSTPRPSDALHDFQIVSSLKKNWLRGPDSNRRPSGYEPDELPGCSTPRPWMRTILSTRGDATPFCVKALNLQPVGD